LFRYNAPTFIYLFKQLTLRAEPAEYDMAEGARTLCIECQQEAKSLSFGPDKKEVALVCSQVCSDRFWTAKLSSGQDKIGFLVSSDPGFVPGVDNEVIDRTVRNIANLPYAPAHQWLTQEGVRHFENEYSALKWQHRRQDDDAKFYEGGEVPPMRFNYFTGLHHLYVVLSKKYPKMFPRVPRRDLEYYHFSGRALVAGVIFNDAPSFYAKHPDAWKMYIDRDIRVGDESYTRRLMAAYGLTYDDYNLMQEYHYNPSINKIVALAKFGAQAKAAALINETLDKYYGGDAVKMLGVKSRDLWIEWILPSLAKTGVLAGNVASFTASAAKIAADKTVPQGVRDFFSDPYTIRQMQNFVTWLPLAGVASWTTSSLLQKSLEVPASLEEIAPWLEAAGKWVYQLFQTDQDVLDAQGDPSYQKWHSMSRPREFKETNGSLQDEIVDLLAGWMQEALETSSVFALGHIFHCIEDSFSRSHTRRALRSKPVVVTRKLAGDITITVQRYTKLIGFQHYEDELDHPPSDTWIAAIGRNPKTMREDPEFTARRNECISALSAVAALYYHFFARAAHSDLNYEELASWKSSIVDMLRFVLREGPYSIEERDRQTDAGGSYKSIMRPTILYRVCTQKRDGEVEDYCRPATKSEEDVLKITPFNLKVNMTMHEERVTRRFNVKVLPTYTEADLIAELIRKLEKDGIKATPLDFRVYFTEEDLINHPAEDIIPANPFGSGGPVGVAQAIALRYLKKSQTLAHAHLENNSVVIVEKQKNIANQPAVRTVKEFLARVNTAIFTAFDSSSSS
jgi:hypothetical protein